MRKNVMIVKYQLFLIICQPVITWPKGLIMQNKANYAQKIQNYDFWPIFDFDCLNMYDIADYGSTNDNGEGGGDYLFFRSIFQVEETSSRRSSNNDEDGDNDGEGWGDN